MRIKPSDSSSDLSKMSLADKNGQAQKEIEELELEEEVASLLEKTKRLKRAQEQWITNEVRKEYAAGRGMRRESSQDGE